MLHKVIFTLIGLFLIVTHNAIAEIRESGGILSDAVKAESEPDAYSEAEALFNRLFKSQINYFGKVKAALPADAKRVQDIEELLLRFENAILTKDIAEKDDLWAENFQQFSTPMFINNATETTLSDEDYQEILDNTGIHDAIEDTMHDVAIYFWKMAKESGKIVSPIDDEQMKSLIKDRK